MGRRVQLLPSRPQGAVCLTPALLARALAPRRVHPVVHTRSFAAPPNVRALRLDVQPAGFYGDLSSVVDPFVPSLEHLRFTSVSDDVQRESFRDLVIDNWTAEDGVFAELLQLCPSLRRLDCPVEVSRRLRPCCARRDAVAPPHQPRGLPSAPRSSSRR